MNRKGLFLDANVLVNIAKNKIISKQLIEIISNYDYIYYSNFSLFIAELKGIQDYTTTQERQHYDLRLQAIIKESYGLGFDREIFESAKMILVDRDFEDACQVATALKNKCNIILTSDKEMYKNYRGLIEIILV